MWKRRDPSEPEPPREKQVRPEAAAVSPSPVAEATATEPPAPAPSPTDSDDPYAQLENFFNEPLVLEDIPAPSGAATTQAQPPPAGPAAAPGLADTVQRLEQFGQRLAARFEALEAHVQEGSAQTLEALRRLGERMGSELAMLEKRAVNLELTMARLRSTTEALELSLRKLPDLSGSERTIPEPGEPEAAPPDPVTPPSPASSSASRTEEAESEAESAPLAREDALFTLEEEVPPEDWDELPPEDPPPPDPSWP